MRIENVDQQRHFHSNFSGASSTSSPFRIHLIGLNSADRPIEFVHSPHRRSDPNMVSKHGNHQAAEAYRFWRTLHKKDGITSGQKKNICWEVLKGVAVDGVGETFHLFVLAFLFFFVWGLFFFSFSSLSAFILQF